MDGYGLMAFDCFFFFYSFFSFVWVCPYVLEFY